MIEITDAIRAAWKELEAAKRSGNAQALQQARQELRALLEATEPQGRAGVVVSARQGEWLRRSLVAVLKLPEHSGPTAIREAVGDLYDRHIASAATIAKWRQEVLELERRLEAADELARGAELARAVAQKSADQVHAIMCDKLEHERTHARDVIADVVFNAVRAACEKKDPQR